MPEQTAKTDVQQAEIQAVVIRADGSREDLGVIAYYHRNPLKRALWAVKQKLRSK